MKRRLFLRGIMGMTYPTDEPFVNRPPRPLLAYLALVMSYYRVPAMHGTDPSCSPTAHGRITAMGPIAEPFYIVPHSMLCDLLRGRNPLATADSSVQPTIYRPHSDSPPDNLPSPIFGPFSQPNIVQSPSHPYLPSHTTPLTSSAPSHNTYPDTPSPPTPSPVEANNLYGQSTPNVPFSYPPLSPTIASDSHTGIPVPICPPCAHTTSSSSCLHPADPVSPTPRAPQQERTSTETPPYPPLRAPACIHCHRSRKKCGKERPCKRCVHSGLVCIGRAPASRRAVGGAVGAGQQPRASPLSGGGGLAAAAPAESSRVGINIGAGASAMTGGGVGVAVWGDVSLAEAYGPSPASVQSERFYGVQQG